MSQVDKPAENRMNINLGGMGGVRAANMNPNGVPRGPQGQPQQLPPQQTPQQQQNPARTAEMALDTYIYDYFCKAGLWECAGALMRARNISIRPGTDARGSPGKQRGVKHDIDGNPVNGDTSMGGTDTKQEDDDEQRESFPQANVPQEDFLLDWFLLFWDIYSASAHKGGAPNSMTSAYVNATQQQKQFQQHRYMNRMGPQAGMMGPGMPGGGYPAGMGRGMVMRDGGDGQLLRNAVMNSGNRNGPMLQMGRSASIPGGPREGEPEVNGQQRSQSPASAAAAANSPGNKRQNIGNGEYRDQNAMRGPMRPGVTQGHHAINQAQQMLQKAGVNPSELTPQQFSHFNMSTPAGKQLALQEYSNNVAQQGSPMQMQQHQKIMMGQMQGQPGMMPPGADPNDRSMGDYYGHPNAPHAQNGGHTHALADYQMQLMVLEQQNKKRLLKARAEQDDIARGGGNIQGMSPPGSRAQPSPQPQIDMKRGTPKMGAAVGPGSPLPDGQMQPGPQQRQSPAAMQGFNGQPQDPNGGFYGGPNAQGQMANGPGMRPPSSHPNGQGMNPMGDQMMGQNFQRPPAGRGQPGGWPQQQGGMPGQPQMGMQSGPQQGNQPAVAGPGARQGQGNMPGSMPPPAQPNAGPGGRGPSSPSLGGQAQPPTPTQANKAAPKAAKPKNNKRPPKKPAPSQPNQVQTAATPSSGPPTPTPTTPITPQHASSFNNMSHLNKGSSSFPGGTSSGAPAAPTAPTAPGQMSGAGVDNVAAAAGDFGMGGEDAFNFGGDMGNDTLLETFDFDSFLHSSDEASAGMGAFDTTFNFGTEGVEAGES